MSISSSASFKLRYGINRIRRLVSQSFDGIGMMGSNNSNPWGISMKKLSKPGIAAAILACSVPLAAQSPLEEVLVTAQKREQNLSDVSLSVTAFSGTALRELNLTSSVDIAAQTPGMNIGTP